MKLKHYSVLLNLHTLWAVINLKLEISCKISSISKNSDIPSPLTKTQKILWILLSVILPYLTRKLSDYAANKDTPFWRTLQSVLTKFQKLITVA